jgi:ribosome biogenesis GTPase A
MSQFIPRQVFPHYGAIPRSYFLGHHRAGLTKMKSMLSLIDYVVECRDYRAPVTSINPMFEEALGKIRRLIVYTKRDLGGKLHSAEQQSVSHKPRTQRRKSPKLTDSNSVRKKSPKLRPDQHRFLHRLILPCRSQPHYKTSPRRCFGA